MLTISSNRRSADQELVRIVRSVRNRWRLRIALRGATIVFGGVVAVFLATTFGMDLFRFDDTAVTVFRVVAYVSIVALALRFLVWPFVRGVTDERVALYLEEHEPSLQAALLSAVEIERAKSRGGLSEATSPDLTRQLVAQAVDACRQVEYGRRVERRGLRQTSGTLAGIVAVGAVALLMSPGFLRNGAPFLLFPFAGDRAENPYAVSVTPGDTLLARGADLLIGSALRGFDAERVELVVKRGADGEWERFTMMPGADPAAYELFLFDLDADTDYYVEAAGVRSPMHRIEVADLPYVQQIDLEYRFPAYSGLSPRIEENTGDIAALRGTRVIVSVRPTIPVPSGTLIIDGGDEIPLESAGEGIWQATVPVSRDAYYRIELEGVNGRMVVGSPDYTIDALDDQPPSISVTEPGRDTKVTNIEEVFIEGRAEDDYGLGLVQLIYSVNGGPEDTLSLYEGGRGPADLTVAHTFYLEEWQLEPGDLVSYYMRVRDNRPGNDAQTAATDIYFLEIRPFRRDYRQADAAPGVGGGGGGDQYDGNLSAQQRDIVAATFKMVRDRAQYSDEDYAENLATLALAQGRVRDRVQAIVRRLGERAIVQRDSSFRKVAEELPGAIEEMETAEERLGRRDPEGALPPAQRALQHLQRADAAFREVQVSQGGGGGGGGGAAQAEDLADLFELELDKLRNQYESVQRGQQQDLDNEIDATLQRLRELARRQQQENERMRQRAAQMQQGAGGASAQNQRRLAEETEELARQLERLSREQSLPELGETARSLQEAADAMRRSAAGQNSESLAEGLQAQERLREARRLLEENQSARLGRDAQDALRRARRLAQEQRDVAQDVENLPEGGAERGEQLRRLVERKEQMADEVADLERQLDEMARESRRDQPEAARGFEEAAGGIRENQLKEKIRYSRGVMQGRSREYASNFEDQIASNLDELEGQIESAIGEIGESEEQQLGRTLDRARDAVRGLESLRERIDNRAEQNAARDSERQDAQQQGQPGEPQGQQDQRTGQDGQQGGQQGQQQGQGQGQGAPRQGGSAGGFGPDASSIGGRLESRDIRQFRGEFGERRGDIESLRQELRQQGIETGAIDEVLGRLRDLEQQRAYRDLDELRRLQEAVIEGLKEFEYAVRREFQSDEARPVLAGGDDVPSGYRQLVEEYFRELSNTNKNPR